MKELVKAIVKVVIKKAKNNMLAILFIVLSALIYGVVFGVVAGLKYAMLALSIICYCKLWHDIEAKRKLHRVYLKSLVVGAIVILSVAFLIPFVDLFAVTLLGKILKFIYYVVGGLTLLFFALCGLVWLVYLCVRLWQFVSKKIKG